MNRKTLSESNIAESIHHKIGGGHSDVLLNVINTVSSNNLVVIGMKQNPICKRAKNNLDKLGLKYEYLEYGSYLSQWKPRLTIKMWSGWPTYPMVFINGCLIGGNAELEGLIQSKKIHSLISE